MMVLVYKINITEGDLAFAHGMTKTIDEAYFPDYGLFINKEACFIAGKQEAQKRYKHAIGPKGGIEIDVDPSELAEFVKTLKETNKMTKRLRRQLFRK